MQISGNFFNNNYQVQNQQEDESQQQSMSIGEIKQAINNDYIDMIGTENKVEVLGTAKANLDAGNDLGAVVSDANEKIDNYAVQIQQAQQEAAAAEEENGTGSNLSIEA